MNFERCSEVIKNKVIVKSENKSSVRIVNKKKEKIQVVTVDGCLIGANEAKCDYLFNAIESGKVFYVELKGSDIDKALEQLKATINKTEAHFRGASMLAFISSSNIPSFQTTFQKKQKKFRKDVGVIVSVKKSPVEIVV